MDKKFALPVLLYHRIVEKETAIGRHKIYIQKSEFENQMRYLSESGIQTITFEDLNKDPLMDLYNKVILTFDDGYADNYTLMFPILKRYGFKAVIYLVTGLAYNQWGVAEGEPNVYLMNKEQLKELCDYGIEIGGHTRNHLDLSKCDDKQLINEIAGCKDDIEQLLKKKVTSFAYPFGGLNERVKDITKKSGYAYAVSTNTGPKQFMNDLFQIRRIEITPKTTLRSFKNKVSGYFFQPTLLESIFRGDKSNK